MLRRFPVMGSWRFLLPFFRRIYARYYLGMAVNEIAEVEGVDPSRVRDSIRRGLKQLVKYF